MIASKKYSLYSRIFVCCLFIQIKGNPIAPAENSQSHLKPQLKQLSILEQAAGVVRNFIDRNLQYYLALPTPPPQEYVPKELQNSLVGTVVLGTLQSFQATVSPLAALIPPKWTQETTMQPISTSSDPNFVVDAIFSGPTIGTPPAQAVPKTQSPKLTYKTAQPIATSTTAKAKPNTVSTTEPSSVEVEVEATTKENEEEASTAKENEEEASLEEEVLNGKSLKYK